MKVSEWRTLCKLCEFACGRVPLHPSPLRCAPRSGLAERPFRPCAPDPPQPCGGGRIEGAEPPPSGAERGLTAGLPPHALPTPAPVTAGELAAKPAGAVWPSKQPKGSSAPVCPLPASRGRRGGGAGLAALLGGAGRAAARSRSAAAGHWLRARSVPGQQRAIALAEGHEPLLHARA